VTRDRVSDGNSLVIASNRPLSGQRIVDAASRNELSPDLDGLGVTVGGRLAPALRGGSVYTDDRAPVEWLTDLSILRYAVGR
jgi:hypothetical protein